MTDSITAKLHALGYEKDLIYGEETYPIIYQLCKLEAVDQPKPLTERGKLLSTLSEEMIDN